MLKEKLKNFTKEHKKILTVATISGVVIGAGYICVKLITNDTGSWKFDIPWNETGTICFAKRWMRDDEFKGHVVIGLRNLTADNMAEQVKTALNASGFNEETVLKQVILTTIEEAK